MPKKVNVSKGEHVALFNTIAIEIASKCNRTCHFCPNSYHKREDVFMEDDTVFAIIKQLKELKYKGRIEWYIYNEPTRDDRLIFFITHARLMLPSCCQMINTNGDYFKSAADIDALFAAGLNQMQINIYSSSDNSDDLKVFENGVRLATTRKDLLQSWVDSLEYIDQTKSLYLNCGPKKKLAKVIAKYGISDKFGHQKEQLAGFHSLVNRAGNIGDFLQAQTLEKPCTKIFRFLNINYSGDAIICCNDYYGETNLGNVHTHTLLQIWNSYEFNLYRLKLQNKKRDCFLCQKCDYNGGYYPHMCDTVTFGDEIDEKYLSTDFTKRESLFKNKPTITRNGIQDNNTQL